MKPFPELLEILLELKIQLQSGHAPSVGLQKVLEPRSSSLSRAMKIWHIRVSAGQSHQEVLSSIKDLVQTPARKNFMYLMNRGFKGSPIFESLSNLEAEFYFALEQDLERQVQLLPIKLLIPLTFFILPAVMILLLSPVLNIFERGFQ